jgi:Protein of unknown function (DUF2892)
MMTNVQGIDRFVRLAAGLLLAELGFFWLAGAAQIALYVVAGVLIITALAGFCPLYRAFGRAPVPAASQPAGLVLRSAGMLVIAVIVIAGSYASNFATRKFFLEDYAVMNNAYKQTLFHTGKNQRALALTDYDALVRAYGNFQKKYSAFHPYAVRSDAQFDGGLDQIGAIVAAAKTDVTSGDLQRAHVTLEQARPLLQGMLKRNGFSMLAVALIDFHDAMELVIDAANATDAAKVGVLYPEQPGWRARIGEERKSRCPAGQGG